MSSTKRGFIMYNFALIVGLVLAAIGALAICWAVIYLMMSTISSIACDDNDENADDVDSVE